MLKAVVEAFADVQLSKELVMPSFKVEKQSGEEKRRKEEASYTTQADRIKKEVVPAAPPKTPYVKCLCKHGECRKGEKECYKCHHGWTGLPLCDERVKDPPAPTRIERRRHEIEEMPLPLINIEQ